MGAYEATLSCLPSCNRDRAVRLHYLYHLRFDPGVSHGVSSDFLPREEARSTILPWWNKHPSAEETGSDYCHESRMTSHEYCFWRTSCIPRPKTIWLMNVPVRQQAKALVQPLWIGLALGLLSSRIVFGILLFWKRIITGMPYRNSSETALSAELDYSQHFSSAALPSEICHVRPI